MAGDWIKMRTDLYRDPKVICIADELSNPDGDLASYVNQNCQRDMTVTRNVMRNVTVGALVAVWGVIRHQGKRRGDDLFVSDVPLSVIDDIAELPGFGEAMHVVGWVRTAEDGLVFPKFFAEHNADPIESAKAKNRDRQARYRERHSNVTNGVTDNVTVTHRVEKSREEKNKNNGRAFVRPTLAEVTAYCRERNKGVDPQKWFDHYESNGWRVGKNPMRNWKASVRQWEGNEYGGNKQSPAREYKPIPHDEFAMYARQKQFLTGPYKDKPDAEGNYRVFGTLKNGRKVESHTDPNWSSE